MTSKERVLAAANHKVSDRTPITFDTEKEVYETLHKHFGTHGDKAALFDNLHCDTWIIGPGNYIELDADSSKKEKRTSWGWKMVEQAYSGGTYNELAWSPFAGKDDPAVIDQHIWPTPQIMDWSTFPAQIEQGKGRAIIASSSWGAYFLSSFLRGMEDIMMDFAINQPFLEKLINTVAERVLAIQEHMLSQYGGGIHIVYMADDYCSQRGPLFAPADFKRYVTPYLRKCVELAHKHGKKFLLHCCGAVRPLLPMIIDCGVDMLEPIQIRAEGMEPAGLKRDFGKDLCFYGGLDLQQVLCKGTPQVVADEVKRLIDILGDGGGYIFGPGHTYIQVDAPLENILVMYKTAYEYGSRAR